MQRIGRYCDFCGIHTDKNKKHNLLRLCSKCRIWFHSFSLINWRIIRESDY